MKVDPHAEGMNATFGRVGTIVCNTPDFLDYTVSFAKNELHPYSIWCFRHEWLQEVINKDVREERFEQFSNQVEDTLNRCSVDTLLDVPDYVLAEYLVDCLKSFDKANVTNRKRAPKK